MATPGTSNPFHSAPPLVRISSPDGSRFDRLCGSSFIIADDGERTLLATACHVVEGQPAGVDEPMAIAVDVEEGSDRYSLRRVQGWHLRPDVDLAIGWVEGTELRGFEIGAERWPRNRDVMSIEHSGSIHPGDEPGSSVLAPLLRKGHVVTMRRGLHWRFPEVTMIELSFPAMKGASGAPVFHQETMAVVGVLVRERGARPGSRPDPGGVQR